MGELGRRIIDALANPILDDRRDRSDARVEPRCLPLSVSIPIVRRR